jgi:hypothetical protein
VNNSTQPSSQQGHSSKAGGGGAHGNRFVVSDFGKLLRWRRGLGLLDDAMRLAVLDIVIPRHAQSKTTVPLDKALAQWVTANMPEIVETYGAEWVEARRVEMMSREHDSFPTMDEIAGVLRITQDEVDGACLCSLVAFGNSKADREQNTRSQDRARSSAYRIKNGATPHSQSKARTKPWEAAGMSERTYYRKGLHEASSGDHEPIARGRDSSGTEPLAEIRPQQCIYITGDHDIGQDAVGVDGALSRRPRQIGEPDVSEDVRLFMQARRLPDTVELPF